MQLYSGSVPQDTVVLLYFTAPWCVPCKSIKPQIEKLTGIDIIQVDVDTMMGQSLAVKMDVQGLPSFVVVQSGRVVDGISGSTTIDKIERMLAKWK